MITKSYIEFINAEEERHISGLLASVIKIAECDLNLNITIRNCKVMLDGDESTVLQFQNFIEQIKEIDKTKINKQAVMAAYKAFYDGDSNFLERQKSCCIEVGTRKPYVFARTIGQQNYIKMLTECCVTFCIGPAGTGKTYLAIAKAVNALLNDQVNKIILTRPAIEAGEHLGFLPGDLKQKIDPYVRPLFDALHNMLPAETIEKNIERGIIEVAPLAYMRGRTLNNAFIILDEAQNTTSQQMLMFLTRLGHDSKCVVTGDPSQIDLDNKDNSGLIEASQILKNVDNLGICELTGHDVIRHSIVQNIIEAYERKKKVS